MYLSLWKKKKVRIINILLHLQLYFDTIVNGAFNCKFMQLHTQKRVANSKFGMLGEVYSIVHCF
jgi:hypothetical protein